MIGNLMLFVWVACVGTWGEAWNLTTVYGYEELGFGRLVYLGPETASFGPSQLLIYKYRWEGYRNAPEGYRAIVEWWFAPVSFGTLIAKMYWESPDHTEWVRIELLSVELVSPQPRPNIVINANLDKTQLKLNEEVTITITASNTGNAMGTHNLTVSMGGKVKKSWLIVLNPGETKSISHKLSFTEEGSYAVDIGGQTVTLTVSKGDGAAAAPEIPWLIIIGIVVAVVGVVLMVLLLRRKPKDKVPSLPPPPPPTPS
jgi:hypothetical protein